MGRVDQMALVRGNNVYPSAVDAILRQFDGVAEYRAEVIESPRGNRLHLVVEPVDSAGLDVDRLRDEISQAVRERLFFTPEVTLAPKGSLPRFEFKALRFVRVTEDETPESSV